MAPVPRDLAERLLLPLGDRWLHVRQVGARAAELVSAVPVGDGQLLVDCAWLHDVGYAPEAVSTGFHPLDGARFLSSLGYSDRLVALVAHHSGACYEAAQRGLVAELDVYRREDGPLLDALTCADMTTGPAGQRCTLDERVAEVLTRYRPESAVHKAVSRSRPYLAGCVARTMIRLGAQPT